jgi:hypothetical protein
MSQSQLLMLDDPNANSDWVSCLGRPWEEATATADLTATVVLMATVDMGVMGMGMDTTTIIMVIAMGNLFLLIKL